MHRLSEYLGAAQEAALSAAAVLDEWRTKFRTREKGRFDLVTETAPDDLLIERDGARVVVDPVSLPFMQGSEIDFVDDLIGAQFKVNNPNVTASCGCGTSFSI